MPRLASISTCTGCLACVDICSKQALSSSYNEEGHLTYRLDSSKCVDCGLCEKVCPVISKFQYGENNLTGSQPYAAWAQNLDVRLHSSSGGVFAALATFVVSQGGVAVGACLQHNEVKHIIVEKKEDIIKLQGSKYTQSNTEGIYSVVKEQLREGKLVLFSGLGCQIAGLLSFLGNQKYTGELITIDLICGGVPSRFLIDRYLWENPQVEEILAFRNKSKYELTVRGKDGSIYAVPKQERPLPLCGFYIELTNRYSCYDCKFTGAHRQSDITIGDLWGDKQYIKEHKNGVSLLIVHSPKGTSFLQKAHIEYHPVDWKDVLPFNPRMVYGKTINGNSRVRRKLSKAFHTETYELLKLDYAGDANWRYPLSYLRKTIHYLQYKLYRREALAFVKHLLLH